MIKLMVSIVGRGQGKTLGGPGGHGEILRLSSPGGERNYSHCGVCGNL